ncbi:MAG: hypothetical protein AAGF47_05145 [Planctomycetota bacterium]
MRNFPPARHLPIYWRWWRISIVPGLTLVPVWWASDHVFDLFGPGEPDWLGTAILAYNAAVLLAMVYLLTVRPLVLIRQPLRDADDIAHICTHCLYISDRLPLGEPCPECGKTHPDHLGERWRTTGGALSTGRRVRAALRSSAALNRPDATASEAVTAPPD